MIVLFFHLQHSDWVFERRVINCAILSFFLEIIAIFLLAVAFLEIIVNVIVQGNSKRLLSGVGIFWGCLADFQGFTFMISHMKSCSSLSCSYFIFNIFIVNGSDWLIVNMFCLDILFVFDWFLLAGIDHDHFLAAHFLFDWKLSLFTAFLDFMILNYIFKMLIFLFCGV